MTEGHGFENCNCLLLHALLLCIRCCHVTLTKLRYRFQYEKTSRTLRDQPCAVFSEESNIFSRSVLFCFVVLFVCFFQINFFCFDF